MAFMGKVRSLGIFDVVYVDGSFTTDKPEPGDIDAVLQLPPPSPAVVRVIADELNQDRIKDTFRVDLYLRPAPLPKGLDDLRSFFQYIKTDEMQMRGLKPKDRKGILRVVMK